MNEAVVIAVALVVAGGLYIRLRWRRSPRAYRAMIAIAAGYFAVGIVVGAWALHPAAPKRAESVAQTGGANAPATAAAAVGAAAGVAVGALSSFSAKVVNITDGDTVDVLGPGGFSYAVRLEGIDAPEHDQPFGSQSTRHLAELLSGKRVTLNCENERSYGRLICKILLQNGDDACLRETRNSRVYGHILLRPATERAGLDRFGGLMRRVLSVRGEARPRPPPGGRASALGTGDGARGCLFRVLV